MEEDEAHASLGGSGGSNDVALSADREGQAGGGLEEASRNLKQVGHGEQELVGADVAEQREGGAMSTADPDGRNTPDGDDAKPRSLPPNSAERFSLSSPEVGDSPPSPPHPSSNHPPLSDSLSENSPVKAGDDGGGSAGVVVGVGGGGGGGSRVDATPSDSSSTREQPLSSSSLIKEDTVATSSSSPSPASSSPKPQASPIASPSSIRHSSATRSFDRMSSQSSVGTGPILPSVAHQLMRLIDSAIQESDPNALEKLRKVVAGREGLEGEGDLIEGITMNADSNYARQVVDVLTTKMGGVPPSMEDTVQLDRGGDSTIPQVMLSAGAARVGADLLPWLPYFEGEVVFGHEGQMIVFSPRTRMAYALAAVLQACTRNRAMCSAAGLLCSLLAAARAIFSGREEVEDVGSLGNGKSRKWDPTPLLTAIQVLGAHSLSPQDLREWLSTAAELTKTGYSLDVILALERAIGSEEGRGPRSTFEFDGESSGLLGAGESKWPFTNGYAFATWLYVESFADSIQSASAAAAIAGEGSSHMPRLFSFLTSDNQQGIEAYFHGQFLVLEAASGKSKKASFHFQFAFKPRRWYFIGLEHSLKQSGLLSRGEGEVKLYVDGRLTETRTLELPRITKPLAFCCIGTNPPPAMAGLQRRRRLCPLFAEMGPVYIFKEPINERMNRLFTRGGNYLPAFGNGSGTPWMASSELMLIITEDNTLLDAELAPKVHLLYHPRLLSGRSCPDASPAGISGAHRRPAEVLGHVHVATRVKPADSLWAMGEGGPLATLPLVVGSLDKETLQPCVNDLYVSAAASMLSAPLLRVIARALLHPGNMDEVARINAPRLMAHLLSHVLTVPAAADHHHSVSSNANSAKNEKRDEEMVVAVISLVQASKANEMLKVQMFSTLLLDLKLWSRCGYPLQKKLFSSLADMVFTEAGVMRGANAVQQLLDGCRRCYWLIPEPESVYGPGPRNAVRPAGQLNTLVDELLVVVELLVGSACGITAEADVRCLIHFVLDCSQPNQVARVLHLIYRLVVQPNTGRAAAFAEMFLSNGGSEMMLALLRKEADMGETPAYIPPSAQEGQKHVAGETDSVGSGLSSARSSGGETPADSTGHGSFSCLSRSSALSGSLSAESLSGKEGRFPNLTITMPEKTKTTGTLSYTSPRVSGMMSPSLSMSPSFRSSKLLGGIQLSLGPGNSNAFRNVDGGDGIMLGIISLVGALVSGGYLYLSSPLSPTGAMAAMGASTPTAASGDQSRGGMPQVGASVGVWYVYAIQRAFQAAPKRLLTDAVYTVLLSAILRSEVVTNNPEALYDVGHRFQNTDLLSALLQSLPMAPKNMQMRALQDILLLTCTHQDNRNSITSMPEWPEWLLEILLSNYENISDDPDEMDMTEAANELVYGFLSIILEYSMRSRDGWKEVEAIIHCLDWLAEVGGSNLPSRRLRRDQAVPIIKRAILGSLMEFATYELKVQFDRHQPSHNMSASSDPLGMLQTQVVAAVAAGVASEGLSPRAAKAEAEAAAQLPLFLAENSLVLLMLVEDFLRSQCHAYGEKLKSAASKNMSGMKSPVARLIEGVAAGGFERASSLGFERPGSMDRPAGDMADEHDGVSLEDLAAMADSDGRISTAAMERIAASAAAEPYESVRCAFASYGSLGSELGHGWRTRSRLWYGVGLPSKGGVCPGGGSGWEAWMNATERDEDGEWVDFALLRKAVDMLSSLLLDDTSYSGVPGSGAMGGMGIVPGVSGQFNSTGGGLAPGVQGLQQIVDSDQPFFAMLRIVLVSMREEDKGGEPAGNIVMDRSGELGPNGRPIWSPEPGGRQSQGACLLRCVLAPLMNTPISGERRQRVLVAACIMYTEVWHAVSVEHEPIRKQYLEVLLPPFALLLRRWRPLLAGIHGLTDYEGQSPIAFEDKALSTDVTPLEAALAMISPGWGAAFASPPAAMALAMAAAGAGYGGENSSPMNRGALRRTSELESPTGGSGSGSSGSGKLLNFKDMKDQNAPKERTTPPLDRAAAKAAAMAAARDKERKAKIGAKRGWGAVAMCTSGQRRAESDDERFKRWNIQEAIAAAWSESAHDAARIPGFDRLSSPIRGSSGGSTLAMLVEGARRMRYAEVNRRAMASAADDYSVSLGARGWRSLVRRLLESDCLYGAISRVSWPVHVYWKVDTRENHLRQRKRLKRNYKGTDHLGAAADSEIVAAVKKSKSEMPEATTALSPEFAAGAGAGTDAAEESERYSEDSLMSPDARPSMDGSEASAVSPSRQPTTTAAATAATGPGGPGLTPTVMATMATTVMSEVNERVVVEVPAALVQPLKVQKGRFQVTTKRICFIVDDSINMDTPSVEESTTGDDWELIGDGVSSAVRSPPHRRDGADDRSWPLSSLREIHSRRYLLRLSALELFMVDRSNFFFNFMGSDERRRVYRALLTVRPPYLNNVFGSTQRPERLLKKLQLMERWSRREISNFEYLMQLNTLAGRSYNDITQYPVFPWVLQDYSSEILDLNNPSVFRDLSKPIGALNPVRLEKFLERYDNLDDPLIPKFHYGSHYSNAGTVLYYLLRVEPYTSLAVQLQGGKFDHADRMFGDVGATWRGVLEDMSDVKELVPEFFFLPEMFNNQNSLDLGRTQKGDILGDVSLPPWADNAIDFVQKHRAALESEYVSAHLHEWIDLIFGYKQRGPHAITAANVFYYITYDGAVDIDKISDPVQRKATQDQIAYFGQTPAQLLTTPHQPRLSVHDAIHLQTIFRNPSAVCSYAIGGQDRLNVPAVQLCATSETIVTVQGPAPACHVAVHRWQPNTPDDRGIPFKFQHGRTFSSSGSGALMRMFTRGPAQTPAMVMYPRVHTLPAPGINKYAVLAITADGRHLLTGGHGDCSLKLVDAQNARVVESAYAHCSPISCLALSTDGSILVTGSKFAMAILWRIHRTSGSNSGAHASAQDPSMVAIAASAAGSSGIPSSPHMQSDAEGELNDNSGGNNSRRKCIEGPLHVLRGHVDELICCAVNADLDLVATCSKTKGVLLHTIMRGRFLRALPVERADSIVLSSEGLVIMWHKVSRVLQSYTINGLHVASITLPLEEGEISAMTVSADGLYLIVGTDCSKLRPDGMNNAKIQGAGGQRSWSMPPIPMGRVASMDSLNLSMRGGHMRRSSVTAEMGMSASLSGRHRNGLSANNRRGSSIGSIAELLHKDSSPLASNLMMGPPMMVDTIKETCPLKERDEIDERGVPDEVASNPSTPVRRVSEGDAVWGREVDDDEDSFRENIDKDVDEDTTEDGLKDAVPSLMLFEVYTLDMVQRFELPDDSSDVTALALTEDNTNLIVSTSDMQLLVYTDPRVSVMKTDQMLRLGWEGAGLSGLMT